jgi:hypothetical protein
VLYVGVNLWSQEENKTGNVRIFEARADLFILGSSQVVALGLHFFLLFKM